MSQRWPNAYVIRLTGNIGTGKSVVMRLLQARRATTIDADQVVHDLLRHGSPVFERVVAAFGTGIVGPDGEIDRGKLGATVFADREALRRLEHLTHPAVGPELDRRIAAAQAKPPAIRPVVVVEAIKLIESGMAAQCDALWVVTAPPEAQVERLVANRGLTEAEAWLRVRAQPPQMEKVAQANVVIDNRGALAELEAQVDAAWAQVLAAL